MEKEEFTKIIGWVQVILGVIFIVAGIISIAIIPGDMLDLNKDVTESYYEMMEANNISMELNVTSGQIYTQGILTRAMLGRDNLILFGLLEAILIVLSVILILQGLVNLKK